MNIMELGAIGELVGGVAVIVTLVYLSVQVRQGTVLARASAQRETNAAFQSALAHLREEREVVRRGCVEFDSMSHQDQHCFELTVAPVLNHLDQVIRMHQQGLETQDNVEAYGTFCLAILQAPGARSWWERIKPYFVKETREYLERRFADPSSLPVSFVEALPWHRLDDEERAPH